MCSLRNTSEDHYRYIIAPVVSKRMKAFAYAVLR